MAAAPDRVEEFWHPGLDPRVRCFRAGEEVDTFVVLTEQLAVYVDTMSTPDLMRQVIDQTKGDLRGRQVVVLNTHADWDHVYGNQLCGPGGELPGLLVAGQATAARLRSAAARERLAAQQAEDLRFTPVTLTPPHLSFPDTLTLNGGDLTLHLLPTPGHTPDHVSVWLPEIRTLLAGDAAEFPWPCLSSASDVTAMRASLAQMAALDPALVLPCHGGTCAPDLMARNLAYLDRLADRLRDPQAPEPGYAEALAWLGTTPEQVPEFYRGFHQDAMKATRMWLEENGA